MNVADIQMQIEEALKCHFSPAPNVLIEEIGSLKGAAVAPEEEEHAKSYGGEKRRAEFLAGRKLIRRVFPDCPPIIPREDRSPTLPEGVFGSLSHSGNLVAFCYSCEMVVGLDIQLARSTEPGLPEKIISSEAERTIPIIELFSAKEAAFKALSKWHQFIFYPKRIELSIESTGVFQVTKVNGDSPARPTRVVVLTVNGVAVSVAGTPP